MTRAVLSASLSAGVVFLGLSTAWYACRNASRSRELAKVQRTCEELHAVRARLRARVEAHVPGVTDHELGLPIQPQPLELPEWTP